MGIIRNILGFGQAAKNVTEVFWANRTASEQHAHDRFVAVQKAYASETTGSLRFDLFVNALNRLPRPLMALGTVGLFVFAMASPEAFAARMEGLAVIPDPLWWLLGAVVSFYFGARELHHFRTGRAGTSPPQRDSAPRARLNPALGEWHSRQDERADLLDE